MKILAGIDEAGLGPTLGPLVTAAAALAVPDDWLPETPWERLDAACCRSWRKKETRPAVADSKVLYRTGGIAALELTVGAFSLLANNDSAPPVDGQAPDACGGHVCYDGCFREFPLHVDAEAIAGAAGGIAGRLADARASVAHLRAAVLYETALNRRYADGLNKNQALLMETGSHLRRLADAFADRALLIVVDKQGGRDDYLPFLTELFPGAWFEELERGGPLSAYRWRRKDGTVEIRFQAKADAVSFATALASLAAKYFRERAMAAFNAWFAARIDGLAPTAGYPEDARRWLAGAEAHPNRAALGLERVVRRK